MLSQIPQNGRQINAEYLEAKKQRQSSQSHSAGAASQASYAAARTRRICIDGVPNYCSLRRYLKTAQAYSRAELIAPVISSWISSGTPLAESLTNDTVPVSH